MHEKCYDSPQQGETPSTWKYILNSYQFPKNIILTTGIGAICLTISKYHQSFQLCRQSEVEQVLWAVVVSSAWVVAATELISTYTTVSPVTEPTGMVGPPVA